MSRNPSRPAPLDDLGTTCDLLAQVTGADRTQILQQLEREHQLPGSSVHDEMSALGLERYVWNDRLVEFYARTQAFLYETLVWNRTRMKGELRAWIIEHLRSWTATPLRVLTYGDGLGFDSAALALAGHQVTYFEVGRQSVDFARRVFDLNGVHVAICSNPAELPTAEFDAVICLDVLEHVPDPPACVATIAGLLRPDGRLLASAPFWYLHPKVGTHLIANRRYTGDWRTLYGRSGLHPIDARSLWMPLVLERSDKLPPGLFTPAGWRIGWSQFWLTAIRWRLLALSNMAYRNAERETRAAWQQSAHAEIQAFHAG